MEYCAGEKGRERRRPIGRAVIIIVDELAFPVATELFQRP